MLDNQSPTFSSDPSTNVAPTQDNPAVLPPVEASVSSVAPTYQPPKPKTPIIPLILGFLIVIVVATAVGIAYYKNKMTISSSKSPSPSAISSLPPSLEPSSSPSTSPSTSPKSSAKSSAKPTAKPTAKATSKPVVSTPTPTPTPTSRPSTLPTLDLRFGNPSANIKQTIDEGQGDGRVINREYTSIQVGEFDEIPSAWGSKITVCYHIVSNEDVSGKDVKFTLRVDDIEEVSDNLGQYNKLEAGRTYDWCHDVTTNVGSHSAKLALNGDKSLKESNNSNNLGRIDWVGLSDKIAPNYTLTGPTQDGDKTCLTMAYLSDNVTKNSDLKIEEKLGSEDWKTTTSTTYCKTGTAGNEYTYSVRVSDARGNLNEQKKTFVLYW